MGMKEGVDTARVCQVVKYKCVKRKNGKESDGFYALWSMYVQELCYPRRRDVRMLEKQEEVDSWCMDADGRRTALSSGSQHTNTWYKSRS